MYIYVWYFKLNFTDQDKLCTFHTGDKLLHGDFTSCENLQLFFFTNSSHPCFNIKCTHRGGVCDSTNDLNDNSIHQTLLTINLHQTMGLLTRNRLCGALIPLDSTTGFNFLGQYIFILGKKVSSIQEVDLPLVEKSLRCWFRQWRPALREQVYRVHDSYGITINCFLNSINYHINSFTKSSSPEYPWSWTTNVTMHLVTFTICWQGGTGICTQFLNPSQNNDKCKL